MSEFIKPAAGIITCNYACHEARGTGVYGTDIAGPLILRKPAMAMKGGAVTIAANAGSAGNMVEIDSGDCWHRYLHLDAIRVKAGQLVQQGDIVGLIGSTGNSTGPHLHVDLRFKAQATARRIMEPDFDEQPWGWNVDPEVAWSKIDAPEDDDMQHYFKVRTEGAGTQYIYNPLTDKMQTLSYTGLRVLDEAVKQGKITMSDHVFKPGEIAGVGIDP